MSLNPVIQLGSELPTGLAYKKMSDLTLLDAVSSVGSVSYYSKLTGSDTLTFVGTSEKIGTPVFSSEGVTVGTNSYIKTNVIESLNQTLIVVFKKLKAGTSLVFSNFVYEQVSSNNAARGISLAVDAIYLPNVNGVGVSNSPISPLVNIGQWAIYAVSRNVGNYITAARFGGSTKEFTDRAGFASIEPDVAEVCLGGSTNMGGWSGNLSSHSTIAYGIVHSKSLTKAELKTYLDNLAAELNAKNSTYAL